MPREKSTSTKKKLPDKEEVKQEIIQEEVEIEEAEAPQGVVEEKVFDKGGWQPKTEIGKKVKSGEIKDIDQILDNGIKILESEIIDILLPNLESDLLPIGQSKGKFGGGKRSIWRQTQKKTMEGNKPKFAALVVIGNKNGYIGLGYGKSKETVPAREKAIRKSKLNIIKIRRGCGSWACDCKEPHSIPFEVNGKCGSVRMKLKPAPKGSGLVIEKECKKLLEFVGIKDVYSQTSGQTNTKLNLLYACFDALQNLSKVKVSQDLMKKQGMIEGIQ